MATLIDLIPSPTGVVKGPLMPTPNSLNVSSVLSGSHSFVLSKAFCPAKTSTQSIFLSLLYAFSTAASKTFFDAGHISIPIPSPSINGTVGLSVSKDSLVASIAFIKSILLRFSTTYCFFHCFSNFSWRFNYCCSSRC